MFDNLVESTADKGDITRKGGFFAGTLIVYGVLIAAIAIGSILWYDSSLQAENLQLLTELDTPIQTLQPEPEPEPEQPQERPQTPSTTPELAVRREAVYSTEVPLPPKEVSTAASTVRSVPRDLQFVRGATDSDPAASTGPIGPRGTGGGPPSAPPTGPPGAPPPPPPRPTPTPAPKVVRRSGGVLNGQAISKVVPPYPANAKAVRASGAVTVQVTINPDGRVVSATAVNGHPLLRSAAVQAARGWRFSPTRLSGQPVEVTGTIIFNFTP